MLYTWKQYNNSITLQLKNRKSPILFMVNWLQAEFKRTCIFLNIPEFTNFLKILQCCIHHIYAIGQSSLLNVNVLITGSNFKIWPTKREIRRHKLLMVTSLVWVEFIYRQFNAEMIFESRKMYERDYDSLFCKELKKSSSQNFLSESTFRGMLSIYNKILRFNHAACWGLTGW